MFNKKLLKILFGHFSSVARGKMGAWMQFNHINGKEYKVDSRVGYIGYLLERMDDQQAEIEVLKISIEVLKADAWKKK